MPPTPPHDLPLGHLTECQLCSSGDRELVLDLGFHPPCDALLTRDGLDDVERTYPLHFLRCRQCGLAQIDYVIAPDELFYPAYPYRSGITGSLRENLTGIASVLVERLGLARESFVLDIGSNDGTTLEGFRQTGMQVLGVEPTDVARIAVANGIPTIQRFFSEALAKEILSTHGRAAVVTANNMFAHIPNLGDLIRGVRTVLARDGLFLTESHYLVDLLDLTQYDSIYHEHLRYYSLRTLVQLLESYEFDVVDAERIPNYGGSIRVYARPAGGRGASARLTRLLDEERRFFADEAAVYVAFRDGARRSKDDLLALVADINRRGQRVVGIGCPGRSSTLLNYCGIGPDLLPYIGEQPECLKVGLYLPGRHIPIVDERTMLDEQPEYALMLSWHYYGPILAKLRQKGLRSKVILPLPRVQVLDA